MVPSVCCSYIDHGGCSYLKGRIMSKIKGYIEKYNIIFILLISLFITCVVELGVFNFYELTHRTEDRYFIYDLSELQTSGFQYQDGVLVSQGEGDIYIECGGQHVSKLDINYAAGQELVIRVDVECTDGKHKITESTNSFKMSVISRNIHENVKNIVISFESPVQIQMIARNNNLNINKYRMFFVFCSIFVLLYFLKQFKDKKLCYHRSFLIISMTVGMMIIMLTPNKTFLSEDDETHFKRTIQLLDFGSSSWTDSQNQMMYAIPFSDDAVLSKAEMKNQNAYLNQANGADIFQIDRISYIDYSQVCYIPAAVALKVTSYLHFPFSIWFKIGKIANLLLYSLIMYLAIKIMPVKKELLFVFALLPSNLSLASNYSYDGYITALLALSLALFLQKLYSREKVDAKWTVQYTIASAFAVLPKAVYAPLILLPLVFKQDRFKDKKQQCKFKVALAFLTLVLLSTFILPALLSPSVAGDNRGAGVTSVSGQMQYIFSNPVFYSILLLKSTFGQLFVKFFGAATITKMGYTGCASFVALIVLDAVMVALAVVNYEQKESRLDKYQRVFIVFLIFCVNCLIWTALYLSFTEVGGTEIQGVQGRYFLPLFIDLAICVSVDKIDIRIDRNKLKYALCMLTLLIMLVTIYTNILCKYCI